MVEATLCPGGGGIIAMALAARGDFLVTSAAGGVMLEGVGLAAGVLAATVLAALAVLVAVVTDLEAD